VSNPFYTYSGSIIPGTLGRAEAVAAEFQNVQAGFADLATSGTDSGSSGAAYIITTPAGQPTGTLADGQEISFKAAHTNSGAATLNANSTGAVSVLRFNGTPLQAGDITAGSWYTLTYNSTYNAWTLIGATVITFAGSISSASPVNKVGLTAAPGVSSAAAPIDVTFAIDQTISPTWTGMHTWNAANNVYGITVNGGATTGQSFGMVINAGSNSSDIALDINSKAGANLITVYGDGGFIVGSPTGGDRGAGTINAAGAIYVNNVALPTVGGTNTFSANNTFNAGITVVGTATFSGPTTASGTLYANAIDNISGAMTVTASSGLTLAAQVTVTSTATFNNKVLVSGALTVTGFSTFAPSSSGVAVQINAPSGQYAMQISGGNFAAITLVGTGGAFGSNDFFIYQNAPVLDAFIGLRGSNQIHFYTNNTERVVLGTGGAVTINAPTSGIGLTVSGAATINGGATVNAAASGVGLTVNGASGTHSTQISDSAGNLFNAGYLEIPQNTFGTNYASVLSDSGKSQYHNSASAHTFTIDDATVDYNVGASITIFNEPGGGAVTIALQTTPANLIWAPSGSTGNRTLAANGAATVTKVTAGSPGKWFISGGGLT
jgi:hypothetical protein